MMEGKGAASPRGPFTGSHMLNVRNARMRSEYDVNLLRNRLERLRQEERKALKKIEETRRRADQIISLKTRNEETHMRKAPPTERPSLCLIRLAVPVWPTTGVWIWTL